MRKALPIIALSMITVAIAPSVAAAPDGLSFRDLEYQQPRDPLLPSNQSADIVEHSPQANLATATASLSGALPAGTPRAKAEAILSRAGARCSARNDTSETCSYFNVETRDEYVDAVHWNVRLQLANDQVSGLSVDRSWVRN